MTNIYKDLWEDLNEVLESYRVTYCLSPRDILPWITATFVGQIAMSEYDEESIRRTLDHMFEQIKKKRNKNVSNQ